MAALSPEFERMQAGIPRQTRSWLPSLPEVAFASVLAWILVAGQPSALLADGDTGWHIRTGEWILAERRFPRVDLFSFSRAGAEWFAWEWGADVLLALSHRAGGLYGVTLLGGVLIAASSAVLFGFLLWNRVNVILAVLATLLAASASTVHWLARPHLFTCLLFIVSLWLLESDRQHPGRRVWVLVPLAALWANLHGGFLVLLAMLGCYVSGAVLAREPTAARRYSWLLVASAAATLLNPYTFRVHLHIWRYLRSDFIRNQVEEFHSPRFRGESMLVFELLLVGGLLSIPWLWKKREYAPALLVLSLAHAALASVRHVLLYVLAAAPAVARSLSTMLASSPNQWAAALRSLAADYGPVPDRSRARPPLWACGAVLAIAVLLHFSSSRRPVDFPREKFPHAALAAVEKRIVGRRIFTSDQWADYLIYRYYPDIRVFIDGRSDFYGAEMGRQYLEALQAQHRWEEVLDRHGFEVALLPAGWPLATVLKTHPGWRLEYDDGQALVLTRAWRSPASSAN